MKKKDILEGALLPTGIAVGSLAGYAFVKSLELFINNPVPIDPLVSGTATALSGVGATAGVISFIFGLHKNADGNFSKRHALGILASAAIMGFASPYIYDFEKKTLDNLKNFSPIGVNIQEMPASITGSFNHRAEKNTITLPSGKPVVIVSPKAG